MLPRQHCRVSEAVANAPLRVQRGSSRAQALNPAVAPQQVSWYGASSLADTPFTSRGSQALQIALLSETQRTHGNHAAQLQLQRLRAQSVVAGSAAPRSIAPPGPSPLKLVVSRPATRNARSLERRADRNVQRQAADSDTLARADSEASAEEAEVRRDAAARAREAESQAEAQSALLQSQAGAETGALQGDASEHGAHVEQQAAGQSAALNERANAQGTRLTSESSTRASALQQEAGAASRRLQGDVGALEGEAQSTEATVEGDVGADVAGMQGEAAAGESSVRDEWAGHERHTNARVTNLTSRTESLLDQKNALVSEYESPGAHDPERFQTRWRAIQDQVGTLERDQSSLGRVDETSADISAHVEALWSNLSRRGQALLTRVTNVASTAWNTLQNRWSALQRTASALVAGLRTRVDSAVGALQGLATAAWTGLQGAATQAWNGVKGVATSAWTALGTRATAAWTGLKSAATTAWTALQSLTGISVSGLAAKVQGIISRISGVVSGIIDRILNAVQSLLSRVRRATSAALDGLRTRASAAWSTLKNFGTRAWEGVKSLGTRAYEGVKELGTRAWERVKDLGTRAWEGLKNLGTRAWNGLKDLGQRAWNGLKSGWEWLKGRAEAAWKWIKGAWERVKRAVSQFWDWVKRKAREAFAWMKQKWEWLKGLVRRALAWLKAKWEWLKRKVKITIRIRDLELMGVKNFKPWKFVDRESPRVPIVKAPIETPIGPIVLSAFVQGKMEATIAGSVGPITLKNTTIVLQPLASRYTGKTDLHVPGKAVETLTLTGLIGGEANYMGAFGIVEGGLQGTGTATGFGAATFSPRIVYDSGNISLTQRILLEFCLGAVIVLDAIARVKVGAAAPGGGGGGGGGLLPSAPSPLPRLPGSGFGGGGGTSGGGGSSAPFARLPGTSGEAVSQVEPCKEATDGEPAEKVLWEGRWNLGRWTTQECWKTKAGFQLHSSGSALPDLDVNFDVNPVPLSAVLSNMFAKPPGMTAVSGGGAPGSPAPAPCVNAPKCGKTESKTPKGTLTPSKGKFAGKTIGFQQKSNKHTKVADCSVSQLQAAMKLDPAKLEGELAKFVKDCQDGKRPPSQIGSESFGNYGNLVLDAIENGDPDDAFLTTASNAGVAGSKCNKTDKYRVHDDAVEDGKGRPIPPDQQQFHLFPVP